MMRTIHQLHAIIEVRRETLYRCTSINTLETDIMASKAKWMAPKASLTRAQKARTLAREAHGALWCLFAAEFSVECKATDTLTKAQRVALMRHLREVSHYTGFAKLLRTDENGNIVKGGTWQYKQFVLFAKAFNAGEIPTSDGRGKTKGKRAVSPMVTLHTTEERVAGLVRDINALIKGIGFIDATVLAEAQALVNAAQIFVKHASKDIKASVAQSAREAAAIAKAAKDSRVEIAV